MTEQDTLVLMSEGIFVILIGSVVLLFVLWVTLDWIVQFDSVFESCATMDALNESGVRRKPKPGILRLDIKKPRSSSRGSVEFSNETDIIGEVNKKQQMFYAMISVGVVVSSNKPDLLFTPICEQSLGNLHSPNSGQKFRPTWCATNNVSLHSHMGQEVG